MCNKSQLISLNPLIYLFMKTFIIIIMFFNGGTTTLSYQGYDREEAYEYASSICTRFDSINVHTF